MIETIRLTAPLFPERSRLASLDRPSTFDGDHFRRVHSQIGPAFVLRPDWLPEGIGSIGYQSAGGELRWWVEGNLTSCLYGERSKAGSLTASEVEPALVRLLDTSFAAVDDLGYAFPRSRLLQVSRMDASTTRVFDGVPGVSVVRSLAEHELKNWHPNSRRFMAVHGSNGLTAQRGKPGGVCTMKAYMKAEEAARAGLPAVAESVRFEAERRPRERPYLEEMDSIMGTAEGDIDRIGKWVAEATAETNLVTAKALRDGMVALGQKDDPSEAMRLCGAASVLASRGVEGLIADAGVSRSTAFRLKRRIEDLMVAAAGGVTLTAMEQAYESATSVLARDLIESAKGPEGFI